MMNLNFHITKILFSKKFCFSLLFFLTVVVTIHADTDIVTSSSRVTIPPAGNLEYFTPNTKAFYFPGPANTTSLTTKVIIESRLVHTAFVGSTGIMKLMVNGAVVQAYVGIRDGASGSLCRLTNKPVVAPVTSSNTAPWFYEEQSGVIRNYWRVIYAPDSYPSFPSYYNASPYTTCNPYRFEIDITDLLRADVQNEIRVTNLGTTYDLEIISLSVITSSGVSPMVTTETATVSQVEYTEDGLDFYATITPSGGALLKIYTGIFSIVSGNDYCVKINGGTPVTVTAASGGILKTTLPQGTSMHVEIYKQ